MLCCVAACLVLSASAVRELSVNLGHSQLAAYFIGYMALPAADLVFCLPPPLHNVFGLSELIGYQAPLILSLTWRREPQATTLVAFSWINPINRKAQPQLNLALLRLSAMISHYFTIGGVCFFSLHIAMSKSYVNSRDDTRDADDYCDCALQRGSGNHSAGYV